MKPVNLTPADSPVAVAASGSSNLGLIGGAVAGVVIVAVVGVYFAMARVDSVKSETKAANEAAASATSETATVRSTIQSLGQPVVDSDKQLAQGQEQIVVAAYTERFDYVLLAQELRGIMQGTGGWYETVNAASAPDANSTTNVEIVGYMPSKELAASFNERVNGTRSLDGADFSSFESVQLSDIKTKRSGTFWKFTIDATLVDTKAPFAAGAGGGDSGTGTTVADGGGDSELTLSLDPEPVAATKPKAPATPAAPKNPFDVAAIAARGGAGS